MNTSRDATTTDMDRGQGADGSLQALTALGGQDGQAVPLHELAQGGVGQLRHPQAFGDVLRELGQGHPWVCRDQSFYDRYMLLAELRAGVVMQAGVTHGQAPAQGLCQA
jgi:hypothetical protein